MSLYRGGMDDEKEMNGETWMELWWVCIEVGWMMRNK